MNNQQAVDQIVQNLAFEVEAVPKNKSIQASGSKSTPLSVKIKVKKKDEIHTNFSTADDTPRAVQKIRLVNSDQTIMTFDVFMETEFEKKPSRNLRKHIFDMLRPGICLGAVDDDEYTYMPSSLYSANITEPSVANNSDGTLTQTFTLSKNAYQDYTVSTQPGGQKWLFGKCKPGGCLDPPFSEDKYSYKPRTRSGPERGEEEQHEEDVGSDIYSKKIPIKLHDEEAQSNGRHSSIFDSGLFKKKRKFSDKSTKTKLPDKTDSIVDIYQGESVKNCVSSHSNSIITYPPRSDPKISDDKIVKSRDTSEGKSRKSFNDYSEPYFSRPKGVDRIKEKETLDPSDYPKDRSSDATDLRNSLEEPFKMPVPLPIPIPVPIHIRCNKRKLEPEPIATNDNILKTQDDSANLTELDAIPDNRPQDQPQDQESQDAINLKDTDVPPRLLCDTSATGDIDKKLVESSKIETLMPSNVEQSLTPNVIDDHAAALDSKNINDNLQTSEMKLIQSNELLETKTTPQTVKDAPLEHSKDMQQNIDRGNRSGKSESTATETPKSQYNDRGADSIQENYLHTRGCTSLKESDAEETITIVPTMEDDTKRDPKGEKITEGIKKPEKKSDNKDKDLIATVTVTAAASATAAVAIEESLEIYEIPDTDIKTISILSGSKTSAALIATVTVTATASAAAIAAATAAATAAAAIEESLEIYEIPDTDIKTISILSESKTSAALIATVTVTAAASAAAIAAATAAATAAAAIEESLEIYEIPDTDIKTISILSGSKTSAASVKDIGKRSDSGDKNLINVGYKDTDKSISVLSEGKMSSTSVKDETKRNDSPDKHLDNVGLRDIDKIISVLNGSKTSAASVKDKTKRSDSPDKYLDNVGPRDTDKNISVISGSKTSAASANDKTKRSDSPDKHLDNVRRRVTNNSISVISGSKTSAASVKDKTKRSDSPDKHLDNVGPRDTDKNISVISGSKTSAVSAKDKTKRSDSPDKHLDNVRRRVTDKSISILSAGKTAAASVKDKTKRSDSSDKHLDNVGHRDTDKTMSVLSGGKTAASVNHKIKCSDSPDKHLDTVVKIDSHAETEAHQKSMSFIASPVTNFFEEPISKDHEFDPGGVPFTKQIASTFRKFDEDDGTHSTVSRELIGTKSVIYDMDEYIPTTCAKKNATGIFLSDERVILPVDTVIPAIQSTSKSDMKKDTISVELGFHSYLNDKNERILRTFDASNEPKRLPNDSVTVLTFQIRISSNEIRIPVDSEHDLSIIIKSNANQRVSISESGFLNVIDNGRVKNQKSPVQCRDAAMRSSEVKAAVRKDNILDSDATDGHLIDYYERELVPLQLIIKTLRDEIDVLSAQQLIFKDNLFCANKSKLPRLVHSNKKCFGCVRK